MAVKTNYEVNGKKYFRISASFGRDSNGKLIRKFFYGKSEKEAKQKMEKYKESLNNGLINDKGYLSPSMKEWLYEIVRNEIKPSTFDKYEDIYRNYIEGSELAYKLIKDIKPIIIQKYYNKLYEAGKSCPRIAHVNKLLKRFFIYAVDEGYLIRNPCSNITIPGKNEYVKREVETFTPRELKIILNAAENSMIKDIAIVALATGMRLGEVLGLSENDLDLENNTIKIKRIVAAYTDIGKDGSRKKIRRLQSPKTKNSIREIPYPYELKSVFENAIKRRSGNKLRMGEYYKTEYYNQKIIFLTDEGNIVYPSNLNKSWKFFLNRLDIKYRNFHALRHTYATMQFENNVPLKTVSKLLGHSKIDITANTYTHVLKKDLDKSTNIINALKMC